MAGRIVEDESLFETWKNSTAGLLVLKKIDRLGNVVDELISGGKTVQVTPVERRLNQEQAATDGLDCFQNGILTPVKLIETAEDIDQLRGNPNHMSESEMASLFKTRNLKTFEDRITAITNPIALERLVKIAETDDGATVRQVALLKERLDSIAPSPVNQIQTYAPPLRER